MAELRFSYARSSGPGGQHVNKVNTKATLYFDVVSSPSLSEVDKQRILVRDWPSRISKSGIHPGCFVEISKSGCKPPGGD